MSGNVIVLSFDVCGVMYYPGNSENPATFGVCALKSHLVSEIISPHIFGYSDYILMFCDLSTCVAMSFVKM